MEIEMTDTQAQAYWIIILFAMCIQIIFLTALKALLPMMGLALVVFLVGCILVIVWRMEE